MATADIQLCYAKSMQMFRSKIDSNIDLFIELVARKRKKKNCEKSVWRDLVRIITDVTSLILVKNILEEFFFKYSYARVRHPVLE